MSMDQYKGGRGGDRPFYLSVWNGDAVIIDRAKYKKEPIVVAHPFLNIVGGVTPDMLTTLPEGRGRDDGFLARLLFAFPDRAVRRYSREGIADGVVAAWTTLARALWQRPMHVLDGKPAPAVVRMTPEADGAWEDWCQAHYAEQAADDFPERLDGPWGKLDAYAARLALILHLMDLAADPTRAPASEMLPELPRRILADAARLVGYFKAHARRAYTAIGGQADDGGEDVRVLRNWIVRKRIASFAADARHHLPRFQRDEAALVDALAWMTMHHLIRLRPEPEVPRKGPGRKRVAVYDVNPRLLESAGILH
jgi:hypothetical protein